jgi:three-Cys-motif partner protein
MVLLPGRGRKQRDLALHVGGVCKRKVVRQEEAMREEQRRAQQFGSVHTLIKLHALGEYLPAFTTALKLRRFKLHYIDAFAGTGTCYIKVGERRIMVPGSASIATECKPEFHRMVFIEKSPRKAGALRRLKAARSDLDINVINEDANVALPACINILDRNNDRAIAFLDPFGMQLEWNTLQQVASSHIVDVWYLFPLSALYRQATLDASAIDDDKAAALDRILGTHEWYEAFYKPAAQQTLFGDYAPDERTAGVSEMLAWVKGRLETIFAGVLPPKVLRQQKKSGKEGAPLFALFFAVSNPSPAARELAMRIARGVLKV